MYIIFLKFTANKAAAPDHMAGHNAWIAKGFDDGVFLSVGSLMPGQGGAILAHDETEDQIRARMAEDPFVIEGVVTAEIHQVDAKRTIPALDFLKAAA